MRIARRRLVHRALRDPQLRLRHSQSGALQRLQVSHPRGKQIRYERTIAVRANVPRKIRTGSTQVLPLPSSRHRLPSRNEPLLSQGLRHRETTSRWLRSGAQIPSPGVRHSVRREESQLQPLLVRLRLPEAEDDVLLQRSVDRVRRQIRSELHEKRAGHFVHQQNAGEGRRDVRGCG